MSLHQFNPNSLPDSQFKIGSLKYLVAGNKSRLLDQRRTPGEIEKIFAEEGMFRWRINDFEDKGKYWDLPLESVDRMQFAQDVAETSNEQTKEFQVIIESLNKRLIIGIDEKKRVATLEKINFEKREIRKWLTTNSVFFKSGESFNLESASGSISLADDLIKYMTSVGLGEQEQLTSETYVLNPSSGEWIKGLQITIAKLGLKQFVGSAPRTKNIFEGAGAVELRKRYVIQRFSFIQAMFELLGHTEIKLYRGMSSDGDWQTISERFFSSWSFSKKVAEAFASLEKESSAKHFYLIKRTFPIEKLFMSYVETKAMNNQYEEVEAVIMHDSTDERLL